MAKKPPFTQQDMNDIFKHVSPRTLLSWVKLGILGWASEIENGRGKIRKYDLENCFQVGLIEELSSLNVSLELMKVIMHKLLEKPGGISGNIESCVVIYKTKPGFKGWDTVPPVARYGKDEMWQLLEMVLMAPVWEYPSVIIISLNSIVDRVNDLIKVA